MTMNKEMKAAVEMLGTRKRKKTFEPKFYNNVVIKNIELKLDNNGNPKFFILKFEQYKDVLLNFWEDGDNFQLDDLCEMLGLDNYGQLLEVENEKVSFQMVPNGRYCNPRFTETELSVKPIIE